MIFGLDPGLLGGLALHWTCSAMAQSTIAFVTASVAGKTIKTNSFAQVSAEETFDDLHIHIHTRLGGVLTQRLPVRIDSSGQYVE